MKSKNKIIFIVEDNEVYARLLQAFIQAHFPEVNEIKIFSIGEMCLMELHRNPDIVIMDYFLNSKYEEAHNGLEIIKRIKAQKPLTHILVLSAQDGSEGIWEAIKDFDCAYLQKNKDSFQQVELLLKNFLTRKDSATFEPWAWY